MNPILLTVAMLLTSGAQAQLVGALSAARADVNNFRDTRSHREVLRKLRDICRAPSFQARTKKAAAACEYDTAHSMADEHRQGPADFEEVFNGGVPNPGMMYHAPRVKPGAASDTERERVAWFNALETGAVRIVDGALTFGLEEGTDYWTAASGGRSGEAADAIGEPHFILFADDKSLWGYTEAAALAAESASYWTPILKAHGVEAGSREVLRGLYIIPYRTSDGRVLRNHVADHKRFEAGGEAALRADMDAALNSLRERGFTLVAARVLNTYNMPPTYWLLYLSDGGAF